MLHNHLIRSSSMLDIFFQQEKVRTIVLPRQTIFLFFSHFLSLIGSLSIKHRYVSLVVGSGSVSIRGSVASTPYLHLRASGFSRHVLRLNHGSWRSQGNVTCFYFFLHNSKSNFEFFRKFCHRFGSD